MTSLRDYLLDAYGGYADKWIKDRSLDQPIQVDDQGPRDVYPFFCTISTSVPDRTGSTLILTLQNCPCNPELMALVEKRAGTLLPSDHGPSIRLCMTSDHVGTVAALSHMISRMSKRRRKHHDPNWEEICTRTAKSLDRLVAVLAVFKAGRPDESTALGRTPRIISHTRRIIEESSS